MDAGLIPDESGLSVDSMRGSEHYIRHRDVGVSGLLDNGNERRRDELSYHERRALINAGILKPDERDAPPVQTARDPYGSNPGTAPLVSYVLERDEPPMNTNVNNPSQGYTRPTGATPNVNPTPSVMDPTTADEPNVNPTPQGTVRPSNPTPEIAPYDGD